MRPAIARRVAVRRTFLALGLMICEPRDTWPSPMMNCKRARGRLQSEGGSAGRAGAGVGGRGGKRGVRMGRTDDERGGEGGSVVGEEEGREGGKRHTSFSSFLTERMVVARILS